MTKDLRDLLQPLLSGEVQRRPRDEVRHPSLYLEEDIQDRHHEGKSHEVQQRANDIEEDGERKHPLVPRGDEPPYEHQDILHLVYTVVEPWSSPRGSKSGD